MEKCYKLRLYPNRKQRRLLNKIFGCSRFVYNYFLNKCNTLIENGESRLSFAECSRLLTQLKKELLWLKEPDKFALQNVLKDLSIAFDRYYNNISGYPNFKKKGFKNSYRTTFTNNNIEFKNGKVKVPKLGYMKCKGYKSISGRILNATLSKTGSVNYFISICCTDVDIDKSNYPLTNKFVGLDLGIKDFVITSDGIKFENPRFLEKSLEKLAKANRELSRKPRFSSNWFKAKRKVAKLHEKIANQRKDYINKLTTSLVRNYDIICFETLKVKNMIKNPKLSRCIADVSWSEFIRQLKYKCEWYGKEVSPVDTYFASSQICSNCGYKNPEVKNLSIRNWECSNCGINHDRYINASKNILIKGLKELENKKR